MATFKSLQGSNTQATCILISDALTGSGNTDFSVNQPANTLVEEVYVRVVEAPTITSGDIGLTMGYSQSGSEVVGNTSGVDNLLDQGTTLPANTVYKMTGNADTTFAAFATGDGTSETAHAAYKADDTVLYGRIATSTAVSVGGKLEIHVVFRYFH
jgi:hypothetical protein